MASIVDAFSEALNEDLSLLKISLYSIPVFFCANLFIKGRMGDFYFWGGLTTILLLGLLTQGINNVRMNRKEILTLNPVFLATSIGKSFVVMVPQILVWSIIASLLLKYVSIPIDLPHVPLIFSTIVWAVVGSILLTAYLSFAKYLKIAQGFNYKVILESCIDILISLLFFLPQLVIANAVLIGPVAYLFYFFQLPFTHWGFILYCSLAFVVNISIMANYFAQASYEHIKGSNEEYDDHCQINMIEDSAGRIEG